MSNKPPISQAGRDRKKPLPLSITKRRQSERERAAQVRFDALAHELPLVDRIVQRAMGAGYGRGRTALDIRMDVLATHANGNPLRLADLLAADDFNFAHDICGIAACLDRETGRLTRNFAPRFSQRVEHDDEAA